MCRYGINSYKPHYACFECRKTFKRRLLIDIDGNSAHTKVWENQPYKCPECGGMTANMGLDFESPKKTDLKAWNHMKNLYETGITFHSCGCSGPGYIPRDKSSLIDFLNEKKEIYVEHLKFWTTRTEPETESDKSKDWDKNSHFLFGLPSELNAGTRKKRKTDLKKAVEYWTEKVNKIEKSIKILLATIQSEQQ
jgi:DNA-directed RNA polymerase subunit RPC12/RpoP